MHLVNGTGNSPSLRQPTPGVVKQDKSSGDSVDTTKTRSDPQRVRVCKGEGPIGAAKGKEINTMTSCQTPPLPQSGRGPCPHAAGSPPRPNGLMYATPPPPHPTPACPLSHPQAQPAHRLHLRRRAAAPVPGHLAAAPGAPPSAPHTGAGAAPAGGLEDVGPGGAPDTPTPSPPHAPFAPSPSSRGLSCGDATPCHADALTGRCTSGSQHPPGLSTASTLRCFVCTGQGWTRRTRTGLSSRTLFFLLGTALKDSPQGQPTANR